MADKVLPEQLQFHLSNLSETNSLLIIDCRSFLAYNSGHIVKAHNVHCPPIVRRRSGGSLSLENILRCQQTRDQLANGIIRKIVVYDDKTDDIEHLPIDSILALVLKGLSCSSSEFETFFLYGGYDAFHALFPSLCTSRVSVESNETNLMQVDTAQSVAAVTPPHSTDSGPSHSGLTSCMKGDTIKYRPSQDQGDPEAILPWLFLGSAYHATQESRLQLLGINALLSLSRFDNHTPSQLFVNRSIGVDDDCTTDIRCWFPEAIDFIENVRQSGGKVLVHCHAGISRSATVCIAYIMWLKHWTMEYAYQFLKSKRSLIAPNLNFMRQLVEFENELEENGRGGQVPRLRSSQGSSTSTRSSNSSYASALSCCDCDALATNERPCAGCASDLTGALMTSSLRSASSQSLQQQLTPLSHYSTPLEPACHFFSSPYLTKPPVTQSLSSPASSSLSQQNASTASSSAFDDMTSSRDHHHHHHRASSTLTAPRSASVVLLSGLVAPNCGAASPAAAPSPAPPHRPNTAHPALCALPLVTTCAQQIFSFDAPSVCAASLPVTHSSSPTMCNSPLLSPS